MKFKFPALPRIMGQSETIVLADSQSVTRNNKFAFLQNNFAENLKERKESLLIEPFSKGDECSIVLDRPYHT